MALFLSRDLMMICSDYRPWTFSPSWMSSDDSQSWQAQINSRLVWSRPVISVYGSSHVVPRKTSFLAEENISYRYSGIVHYGNGWPDWFHPLLEKINSTCAVNFNGCLINLYRNGKDCMGWHADNEPELDAAKPIASLSLGEQRDFVFKHRTKALKDLLKLNSGDLLIMHPGCQNEWIHSLPRRNKIIKSRINLTFRCYKEN